MDELIATDEFEATCTLTDEQSAMAEKLIEDLTYELGQIFWGSEANLEWSIAHRLESAKLQLRNAMQKLPSILAIPFPEFPSLEISDEDLLQYVKDHPTYGRPRISDELRRAGYYVTRPRLQDAIDKRDDDRGWQLRGGRPSRDEAGLGERVVPTSGFSRSSDIFGGA